ncbi:hypothetical protein BJF90_19195 [Pseudonocardia sp. CNS-004]|nr:hypothetical protein BJF90_19195 [Pseudonocardia sp. CNS-004]
MELHQLRYFVAVAREGSMTQAAASLFLAQPTLSIQIRKLEQEVGTKLFERLARRVVLTAAGHAFLEHAERALAELEQGRDRVADASGSGTAGLPSACCRAWRRTCSPRCSPDSAPSTRA